MGRHGIYQFFANLWQSAFVVREHAAWHKILAPRTAVFFLEAYHSSLMRVLFISFRCVRVLLAPLQNDVQG